MTMPNMRRGRSRGGTSGGNKNQCRQLDSCAKARLRATSFQVPKMPCLWSLRQGFPE
jgi:hypothetical protein